MPQAETRVSTPRRTASKIKPKKVDKSPVDHGAAFRDLESPVRELFCMATIARQTTMKISGGDDNEIAAFAVAQLCDMVCDFRAEYCVNLNARKAVV